MELCGLETCWIGLSETPGTMAWSWEDGTSIGSPTDGFTAYTNWAGSEPNNYNGKEEDRAFMTFWGCVGMPEPWKSALKPAIQSKSPFAGLLALSAWALLHIGAPLLLLLGGVCGFVLLDPG